MAIKLTLEQEQIVLEASKGSNLAISAFAGAAKTTTCTLIADKLQRKSLYIAFNKSIAEEAKTKFPSWVECRTLHSLAYATIIAPEKMYKKVSGFFDTKQFVELYGEQLDYLTEDKQLETIFKVLDIIKAFCQSDSLALGEFTYAFLEHDRASYDYYLPLVLQAWAAVTTKTSTVNMTHDVYLKMYQLSNPNLEDYEVIYLDEAQDSNPVTLDIFYNQTNSQLIMVGDSYQSIYEWRGAVNAFDSIPDTFKRLYLTESFRFTPEIAELATKLTSIAGNDRPIIGKAEVKPVKTSAIIVRTNASIIDYLLAAVQENYKVHVVADLQDLWSKLYHLSALATGAKPKFPNAELRRFNTIGDFATEAERNPDLKRLAMLSFKMSQGRGTHGNIVAIKGVLAETPAEGKFTVITAHKSKGLEFDAVTLDRDMLRETEEGGMDDLVRLLKDNQTLNLLYVAMTRAKYQLTLPSNVYDIFDNIEELTELWDKTASN